MASRSRDGRKQPDNLAPALSCGARWLRSIILLVSQMLGSAVATAQPTERPPDTMEARLLACAACHGRQGEGTKNDYFPRLAGKPAGYLMNQLVAFRDGRRRYPPMNYLLEYLPDAYLQRMADYFASLRPAPVQLAAAEVSASLLVRGRSLVSEGDPAHGVPPCSGCHGPKLTGMEPAIPGLVGLHASYISAQLGAFRYGTRTAAEPDCMQLVAASLTESDVTAVAAWLASLPIPVTHRRCRKERCPCLSPAAANQTEAKGAMRIRRPLSLFVVAAFVLLVGFAVGHAANDALVTKGEYLARAGDCIACHTNPGGALFAGGRAMATPFGTIYTSNITPDPTTGIGSWKADDFYATMHWGRFPDGALIYPAMPFGSYTKVTREDCDAIFAFLHSVPPVRQPNRPHDLRFPFNNRQLILGWRTLFFQEGEYQPNPNKSAEWNRGAYLVEGLGHCAMCHTPINALGGSSESQAFEGGLIPMQNWYAPSLTSNKEAGLGEWRIEEIVDLLRNGVSQRGAVYGPMAEVTFNSLQYLNDGSAIRNGTTARSRPTGRRWLMYSRRSSRWGSAIS